MVALGERRNYQYQPSSNPRHVAALDFVQPQSYHGNNGADEQMVPQGSWPEKSSEGIIKNWQYDYGTNESYYGLNYPMNNNMQFAYPLLQPDMSMMNVGQAGGQEGVNKAPARQNSIPPGTEYLDQYLHSDIDYYNLDCFNLNGYENEEFSVEDYIDLDKVDVCEQDGINFDVPIKQEKTDADEMKNLEEMERILAANMQNPNNAWAQNINGYSVGNGNEPNFNELNNNLGEMFMDSNAYNTSNIEWQSQYQTTASMQPSTVSSELVVKTEPDDSYSDCSLIMEQESQCGLTIPADELVEMPVSRFNELLTTLTPEQCCEAKDIRRRGKNKKAARLCRKRKLDNISCLEYGKVNLEETITELTEENRKIILETEQLKRNIDTICKMLIAGLSNDTSGIPLDVHVLQGSGGK